MSGLADRIAADIAGWDAIGDHRTGTAGDRQTSDWLTACVRDAGMEPHRDDFGLSRWVLERCAVDIDGAVVDGVPLFDGGTTDSEGIVGELGPLAPLDASPLAAPRSAPAQAAPGDRRQRRLRGESDSLPGEGHGDAMIGVGAFGNAAGTANGALAAARRSGDYGAIVAVSKMDTRVTGLALANADRFNDPFGPPVVQVATEHETWLDAALARRATAHLTAYMTRETATGSNVFCRVPGRDPSLAPLTVVTPKSAWWVCTAERGGGIAVWLALLRHFAANEPARDILFIATSGHELGHLGLDHFLATRAAGDSGCWIHLGANFAAVDSRIRLQASDAQLMESAGDKLSAHGVRVATTTPLGERPGGEARNIHDRGERFASLLGSNRWFHHPDDRWPATVDLDGTERVARAVLAIADQLT